MSNYKIDKLTVENFRGFRGSKEFSIDSDRPVVLLYGGNGYGKTSFFDAIEWGLTGKIARYESASKERNECVMLRNLFTSNTDDLGKVSISLDQEQRLTRIIRQRGQGDYNDGFLEENFIEQLVRSERQGDVDFGHAFNLSHILTQELVSRFIRSTKDTERYASIVSLFGLDGYAMFNPKNDEIAKAARQESDRINIEINNKRSEIARNKQFLNNEDIDGDAVRSELASLLSIDANAFPDLKELLSDIQKSNSELASNLELLKADLQSVSFLEQNWQSGQSNNQKITEFRTIQIELPKLIDSCNSLVACQWIADSKEAYSEYCKNEDAVLQHEAMLSAFVQSPEGRLLNAPVVGISDDLTPIYVFGEALEGDFCKQIQSLKGMFNRRDEVTSELEKVGYAISAQLGLEKKLIQCAKDFFVDYPNAKQCPVCKHPVDSNSLLDDLKTRLAQDGDILFSVATGNQATLRAELSQISEQIPIMSASVIEVFNAAKLNSVKKREKLQSQLDTAKELSETGKKIKGWLSYLKIDISQVDMTYLQLKQTIQGSAGFVKDQFASEFYQGYQRDLSGKLESLQKQNEYFNHLIKKFDIASIEKVFQKKNDFDQQNDALLKQKGRLSSAQDLVTSLLKDDRSNLARKRIIELENQISLALKKMEKLIAIPKHCNDLKQKARALIEENTREFLSDYGATIDRIYSHLNPHCHLGKFNFRIDDSNPSNNRLILEALQEEGDIKMNPTYTFSSAQTNVVAISIFLGIALRQQWSNLNALFLDDPIQNMDDINVHSFVDIIRSVIRDTSKQFFISTHDERVFNFMKIKFRQTAQIFRFTGYGEFVKELC